MFCLCKVNYCSLPYLTKYRSSYLKHLKGLEEMKLRSRLTNSVSFIKVIVAYFIILQHKGAHGLRLPLHTVPVWRTKTNPPSFRAMRSHTAFRLSQQVCVSRPVIVFIERRPFIPRYRCEEWCPAAIHVG